MSSGCYARSDAAGFGVFCLGVGAILGLVAVSALRRARAGHALLQRLQRSGGSPEPGMAVIYGRVWSDTPEPVVRYQFQADVQDSRSVPVAIEARRFWLDTAGGPVAVDASWEVVAPEDLGWERLLSAEQWAVAMFSYNTTVRARPPPVSGSLAVGDFVWLAGRLRHERLTELPPAGFRDGGAQGWVLGGTPDSKIVVGRGDWPSRSRMRVLAWTSTRALAGIFAILSVWLLAMSLSTTWSVTQTGMWFVSLLFMLVPATWLWGWASNRDMRWIDSFADRS